jgi:nicotinamide riboside kinase
MYVMKVWCEYVFEKCHPFILDEIAKRQYNGYLLCAPDLPWVKDELREYPDDKNRIELFHIYKDLLVHQSTPWQIVSGSYEERLQQAIAAVNSLAKPVIAG